MSKKFRYAVLGTGSRANSYIFSDSQTTIVIDNGFTAKKFLSLIDEAGFDPKEIDFIFVTHGHSDHIKGVADISQKFRIPVYTHPEVEFGKKKCYHRTDLQPRKTFQHKGLSLFPFEISHDSPGSMGFHFQLGEIKVTVLTDTGMVTDGMKKMIQRSDLLFLEANYCPVLLEEGPYPQFLKERIKSNWGHLSNQAAIELLNQIHREEENQLKLVYFCHLSETNNSPQRLGEVLQEEYEGEVPCIICGKNEMVIGVPL